MNALLCNLYSFTIRLSCDEYEFYKSFHIVKNIHTVEITNIYMYFTLLSRSVPIWFVSRQFDCHWLKFEGVCDSQLGKNSSVAI